MTREEQIKEAARQRADQYDHPSKWSDTYYGFIDGAKWADQHPQWIPVEKELPKEGGHYLVSDGTDSMVDIWLYGVGWSNLDNNNGRVTHWMPLPEPSRKEE